MTVFLDFVGFGIILPVLPFFGEKFGATPSQVAMLFAVYSMFQFFSGPIWGRLSDSFGRRPVLLATLAGAAVAYVVFGLSDSLFWLFAARGLSGLMAGNIGVAHAIVADLTSPRERAHNMALLGAAISLGFVAGPLLGSVLVGNDPANIDHSMPAFAAAALSGGAFLVGLISFRESLPLHDRRQEKGGLWAERRDTLTRLSRQKNLLALILSMAILSYVVSQITAIFSLWSEAVYQWGPRQISYTYAVIGIVLAIVQGGIVGRLSRWIGETRMLIVGSLVQIGGLVMVVLANSAIGAAAAVTLAFAGSSLCTPVVTSLISQRTPADRQGSVLGIANAGASLGRIVGPPLGGFVYQYGNADWPFPLAAMVVFFITLLGFRMTFDKQHQAAPTVEKEEGE